MGPAGKGTMTKRNRGKGGRPPKQKDDLGRGQKPPTDPWQKEDQDVERDPDGNPRGEWSDRPDEERRDA
jgi:hypothetical protein